MSLHPLAGQIAPESLLVDVPALLAAYTGVRPDPSDPSQRVAFGTSGHRGSALHGAFNEAHIRCICRAVAEVRAARGVDGPLFLGRDTHALSGPAHETALEVLLAHGVTVAVDARDRPVATPMISHAIRAHNHGGGQGLADGIVVTPSHNPPEDGGFKYNPPHGGPADSDVAQAIEARANELLESGAEGEAGSAGEPGKTLQFDYVAAYVEDLGAVLDMGAIRGSGLKLGAHPLGGAALPVWQPLAERWGLDLEIVDTSVDPTFRMVRVDKDGKIRMDCSSPYAMAGLVELKESYDLAFGNDTDADRHGIVTRSAGLMNPNHVLAVAIEYLFTHRDGWGADTAVGKTLVSSSMIDRVADELGRTLCEVPVGFKWFVSGLDDGSLGFGGEESAGASFLRRDGTCWTTDKDGPLLNLLMAEVMAVTGKDPAERYAALVARHGDPVYERIDAPATPAQKDVLKHLSPDRVQATELAGEAITARLTEAPGNGAAIGGLKVTTANGWFAARPSGTEDIYKIYAESFVGREHLVSIQREAQAMVSAALEG